MPRKRLTQIFPFLIPFRAKQRKFCYYLKMRFDGNAYASEKGERLPYKVFSCTTDMYNEKTGFDMIYQENKVHNLKLGAAAMEGLLIRPDEVFSYSRATRFADKKTPYKDGLILRDGKLVTDYGGGMCQLTDTLFTLFLNSPLTITERHGHKLKDFPDPDPYAVKGTDATVFEGWLDLKVKNETAQTFQLSFSFDEKHITGTLLSDKRDTFIYRAVNGKVAYKDEHDGVYEEAEVYRETRFAENNIFVSKTHLYDNRCRIGYELQERNEEK